jgi:carboxyl-terminal processing protease
VVKFLVKKLRSGDTLGVAVTRERIHLPDVEYAGILEDGKTGYIYQSGFTEGVSDAVKAAVKSLRAQGMERLVLDLRNNGGGIMQEAVKIVGFFVPKGSLVVSARGRDSLQTREYRTSSDPIEPDLPIVVMVNAGSASASEIVSGALQDLDRATVIGTRTFGKGLVQSMVALPYNGQMKVTTAKYYTPSGRCVQNAPDSLTHEFKTAHGRTVRDGGGITPDYIIKGHNYSRLTYSLVVNGIVEQYTLQYVRNHPTIPAVDDFHFTDYDDFVTFAMDKEFDYRSSARTYFDQMKKTLEEDGLAESMSAQLEAMQKALEMDKETFLRLKKDEIIPFIEEEIAVRYYWQEAGIRVRLRYDDQLREALTKAPIQF